MDFGHFNIKYMNNIFEHINNTYDKLLENFDNDNDDLDEKILSHHYNT